MSQNCDMCRRPLVEISQPELEMAIRRLLYLSQDRYRNPGGTFAYDLDSGGDWQGLANKAFYKVPFKNRDYAKAYEDAAKVLLDGWLPPGYVMVVDKDLNLECSLPMMGSPGCKASNHEYPCPRAEKPYYVPVPKPT